MHLMVRDVESTVVDSPAQIVGASGAASRPLQSRRQRRSGRSQLSLPAAMAQRAPNPSAQGRLTSAGQIIRSLATASPVAVAPWGHA